MVEATRLRIGRVTVIIKEGDITEEDADAIVNPANSLMIMGGGVALAIKRKGGEEIEREARAHAPVPVGKAVATSAGRLKARYVIHAPTMSRPAERIPPENVELATEAALRLADELRLRSVALPALGAGVGGVPVREAILRILETIRRLADSFRTLEEIRLVAYGSDALREFLNAARAFFNENQKSKD